MAEAAKQSHHNSVGFLRIVLASLVILAHTPELHDGNRARELLTQAFGSITFGTFAVDGFFLVSGFLISRSFQQSRSLIDYLGKRVGRIFPGFLVAYAVCVLVVGPLGGIVWPREPAQIASVVVSALALRPPYAGPVFEGMPYPVLNGPMWTIRCEFVCYLMVMALGMAGLLRRPRVMAALALAAAAAWVVLFRVHVPVAVATGPYVYQDVLTSLRGFRKLLWLPLETLPLVAVFLIGCCYNHWRDRLVFRPGYGVAAAAGLVGCLLVPQIAEVGVGLFGGYLMLYFALTTGDTVFGRINAKNDISYGVYLYGWPVEKLVFWFWRDVPLPLAGLLTLAGACACGWASWLAVERPAMNAMRDWLRNRRGAAA